LLVILVLILLGVILYLGLVGIGAILIVADPIAPVDAVVVLSGDDGNRLSMAADMRTKGFVDSLVITDSSSLASSRLAREAQQAGFPADSIYITKLQVESTLDEAIAVREFAQDKGWDSLMIVTDPYHSLRTRIIFRRELANSGIQIYVRPVVGHWFTSARWFLKAEGWQFAFLEIIKLINYLIFRA
jgi:uncharacterized SAM-binding protein YcdF (DUF218 family)